MSVIDLYLVYKNLQSPSSSIVMGISGEGLEMIASCFSGSTMMVNSS